MAKSDAYIFNLESFTVFDKGIMKRHTRIEPTYIKPPLLESQKRRLFCAI